MVREVEIGVSYNDDEKDGGYYSLRAKGHKTRYPIDGLTLIQIASGWIKQELHQEKVQT